MFWAVRAVYWAPCSWAFLWPVAFLCQLLQIFVYRWICLIPVWDDGLPCTMVTRSKGTKYDFIVTQTHAQLLNMCVCVMCVQRTRYHIRKWIRFSSMPFTRQQKKGKETERKERKATGKERKGMQRKEKRECLSFHMLNLKWILRFISNSFRTYLSLARQHENEKIRTTPPTRTCC